MKTFTWDERDYTKLEHGLAVTKFRYDPAFYIRGFNRHVYAIAPRFAVVRNDGYNYGLPEFGVILNASAPRRLPEMGVAHRVVIETAPPRETPPYVEPALIAVHFNVEPENSMSMLFSVHPTSATASSLVCVPFRVAASFGEYTLFYDGDEVFVYDSEYFNAWQQVLDSSDFLLAPEQEVE